MANGKIYRMNIRRSKKMLKLNIRKMITIRSLISLVLLVTILGVRKDNPSEYLGIAFVLGLPMILLWFGTYRGLKKHPVSLEVFGNNFVFGYVIGEDEYIPFSDVKSVRLYVHSYATSSLVINIIDSQDKEQTYKFHKSNHKNFVDVVLSISKLDIDFKCLQSEDSKMNEVNEDLTFDWYTFLSNKRTFKDVFKELKEEPILKKLLKTIGFAILLILRMLGDDNTSLEFVMWFIGIMYVLYLFSSVWIRKKGYSGKEAPLIFVSYFITAFFGLGAVAYVINLAAEFLLT